MMCNDNVDEEIMLWISEWAHFLIKLWPRGNNGPFPPHPSPLCLKQLRPRRCRSRGRRPCEGNAGHHARAQERGAFAPVRSHERRV